MGSPMHVKADKSPKLALACNWHRDCADSLGPERRPGPLSVCERLVRRHRGAHTLRGRTHTRTRTHGRVSPPFQEVDGSRPHPRPRRGTPLRGVLLATKTTTVGDPRLRLPGPRRPPGLVERPLRGTSSFRPPAIRGPPQTTPRSYETRSRVFRSRGLPGPWSP